MESVWIRRGHGLEILLRTECGKKGRKNRFFDTHHHAICLFCLCFLQSSLVENLEIRPLPFLQISFDQKIITTVSMILEASMESSFQFFFQGLFSLPTLVFAFMNIHEGTMKMTDLVNWTNVSIVLSFLSFAYTSYNIRYVPCTNKHFKSSKKLLKINIELSTLSNSWKGHWQTITCITFTQ